MPLVNLRTLLDDAAARGYAIGAFNIDNLESLHALLEVAEEEASPIILAVGQGALGYTKLNYLAELVKSAANTSSIPICLHLDHSKSFAQVLQCLKAGFSSVMIDGSHLPLAANIELTAKVKEAAHAVGASVEGELGKIAGVEDNLSVVESEACLADVAEVEVFVKKTGVDALAPAVGTAHGRYRGEPKIDFGRLDEINQVAGVPLVLHGGSGVPDTMIKQAITLGVSKINVATEIRLALLEGMGKVLCQTDEEPNFYKVLQSGRNAIKEIARGKIRVFGSNGKA